VILEASTRTIFRHRVGMAAIENGKDDLSDEDEQETPKASDRRGSFGSYLWQGRNSLSVILRATGGVLGKQKPSGDKRAKVEEEDEEEEEVKSVKRFSIAGYHAITAETVRRLSGQFANPALTGELKKENDEDSSGSEDLVQHAPTEEDKNRAASTVMIIDDELYTEKIWFCLVSAIVALGNLVSLGVRTDLRCHTRHCPDQTTVWDDLQQIFVAESFLETAVRLHAAGLRRYFVGERTQDMYKLDLMNCFDFIIVIFSCLDCWILSPAGVESNMRLLTAFRIVHIFPFVKHVQLNRSFRELWLVVAAIGEVLKTLCWIGSLVVLVVWVAAVVLRITFLDRTGEDYNMGRAPLIWEVYWGGVLQCAHSLLQVITRDKWADSIVWPIVEKDGRLMVMFLAFLSVANLSLMNVITAIVVESTLSAAEANHGLDRKEKENAEEMVLDSLRGIFHRADGDRSGTLSSKEMMSMLKKRKVKARLEFLALEVKDLAMLFHLLDDFGKGVNIDMFFRGVKRLSGPAQASDLHQLSLDLRRSNLWGNVYNQKLALVNDLLAEVVDLCDEVDIEIIHGDQDFRDPVLVARRSRVKFCISDLLRGKLTVGGKTLDKASKDPWPSINEAEEQYQETLNAVLEDNGLMNSQKGSKTSSGGGSKLSSGVSRPSQLSSDSAKVKAKVKARRMSSKSDEGSLLNESTASAKPAPAAPALPRAVARIKVEEQVREVREQKKVNKKKPAPDRRQYEF